MDAKLVEQLPCAVSADDPFGYQTRGDAVYFVGSRPGCDGYLARVEGHVSSLDAFGGQRSNGCKVLCQADGNHDLRQITSARHAQDLERNVRGRMDTRRAADRADRQRQLETPHQAALGVEGPGR
jgi:hypothetical protein